MSRTKGTTHEKLYIEDYISEIYPEYAETRTEITCKVENAGTSMEENKEASNEIMETSAQKGIRKGESSGLFQPVMEMSTAPERTASAQRNGSSNKSEIRKSYAHATGGVTNTPSSGISMPPQEAGASAGNITYDKVYTPSTTATHMYDDNDEYETNMNKWRESENVDPDDMPWKKEFIQVYENDVSEKHHLKELLEMDTPLADTTSAMEKIIKSCEAEIAIHKEDINYLKDESRYNEAEDLETDQALHKDIEWHMNQVNNLYTEIHDLKEAINEDELNSFVHHRTE